MLMEEHQESLLLLKAFLEVAGEIVWNVGSYAAQFEFAKNWHPNPDPRKSQIIPVSSLREQGSSQSHVKIPRTVSCARAHWTLKHESSYDATVSIAQQLKCLKNLK